MQLSVLIVDSEHFCRAACKDALAEQGHEVRTVDSLAAAKEAMHCKMPDVVIIGQRLAGDTGIAQLQAVAAERGTSVAIAAAAAGNAAVDDAQAGPASRPGTKAAYYLSQPLHVPDLFLTLERVWENRKLRYALHTSCLQSHNLPRVALQSRNKQAVRSKLERVSQSPATPVLITGPSGSGKQFAAEDLHALSYPDVLAAPLVEVDCGALGETDIEAKFYGRESTRRRDGHRPQRGFIELALGGTLVLRDITELRDDMQTRLLRFLDNMRFRRIDGRRTYSADLRVIATTSANIQALASQGKFHQDLYARFALFAVDLAPLSRCPEDIAPLVAAYCAHFGRRIKQKEIRVAAMAQRILQGYSYPGNIRELRNIVERAVVLSQGNVICAEDVVLPDAESWRQRAQSFFHVDLRADRTPLPLEDIERRYVACVLEHFKGHRTAAAEALDISYPTFLKRLREMGLQQAL
jgi:two-component system response regulator AtoC